jgi:proline dehydrogenase
MDILGEFTLDRDLAAAATREYLDLLRAQAEAGVDRNVSIKLSQLGLNIDRAYCLANMEEVAALAATTGAKVRIDMEDSACTDDTLWVFRRLRERHDHVGVVLQAYLHRTMDDVKALADLVPDYRLCKGIYVEPPDVAIQRPPAIIENFLRVLEAMWKGGSYVGVATHNEAVVAGAKAIIARLGLGHDRYEFQMLLGVREGLRDRLAAEGHPVRIYLPFGSEWYAYSVRRLKENPSVAGHVARAMLRPR